MLSLSLYLIVSLLHILQLNCQASIESLVKYAGWNGHVYMITDREHCYQSEKIVSNAGMNPSMFHLIKTPEHFGDGGVDIFHPIVGNEKLQYRYTD